MRMKNVGGRLAPAPFDLVLSKNSCEIEKQQVPPLRYPRFPVKASGVGELHAPFFNGKAHTRSCPVQRGRKSGFAPVGRTILLRYFDPLRWAEENPYDFFMKEGEQRSRQGLVSNLYRAQLSALLSGFPTQRCEGLNPAGGCCGRKAVSLPLTCGEMKSRVSADDGARALRIHHRDLLTGPRITDAYGFTRS